MIKKIIFILILSCVIISCGKKGDPEYKDPKTKVQIQNVLINRV